MNKFKSVLLIDDSEGELALNEELIKTYNFADHVTICKSGQEALNFLKDSGLNSSEQCPEVIFLDIFMPVMNGFEFLEKYEKLPPECRNNKAIILLTASKEPKDYFHSSTSLIVTHWISKPLTKEILNDSLWDKYLIE